MIQGTSFSRNPRGGFLRLGRRSKPAEADAASAQASAQVKPNYRELDRSVGRTGEDLEKKGGGFSNGRGVLNGEELETVAELAGTGKEDVAAAAVEVLLDSLRYAPDAEWAADIIAAMQKAENNVPVWAQQKILVYGARTNEREDVRAAALDSLLATPAPWLPLAELTKRAINSEIKSRAEGELFAKVPQCAEALAGAGDFDILVEFARRDGKIIASVNSMAEAFKFIEERLGIPASSLEEARAEEESLVMARVPCAEGELPLVAVFQGAEQGKEEPRIVYTIVTHVPGDGSDIPVLLVENQRRKDVRELVLEGSSQRMRERTVAALKDALMFATDTKEAAAHARLLCDVGRSNIVLEAGMKAVDIEVKKTIVSVLGGYDSNLQLLEQGALTEGIDPAVKETITRTIEEIRARIERQKKAEEPTETTEGKEES